MTQRKPPEERNPRSGSENRARGYQVAVRLSRDELDALEGAAEAVGKHPATLLREAFLESQNETAIRADERIRIAASLRSLPVLDFLHRHGLEPGAGTARVLCAAAAEIEGPGGPGCGKHPGPQEARDG